MKIFIYAALAFVFLALVKAVKVNDLVIYFEYPFGPENFVITESFSLLKKSTAKPS